MIGWSYKENAVQYERISQREEIANEVKIYIAWGTAAPRGAGSGSLLAGASAYRAADPLPRGTPLSGVCYSTHAPALPGGSGEGGALPGPMGGIAA